MFVMSALLSKLSRIKCNSSTKQRCAFFFCIVFDATLLWLDIERQKYWEGGSGQWADYQIRRPTSGWSSDHPLQLPNLVGPGGHLTNWGGGRQIGGMKDVKTWSVSPQAAKGPKKPQNKCQFRNLPDMSNHNHNHKESIKK